MKKKWLILFYDRDGAHARLLEGTEQQAARAAGMLRAKYDLPGKVLRYLETSGFVSFAVLEDEYREFLEDQRAATR